MVAISLWPACALQRFLVITSRTLDSVIFYPSFSAVWKSDMSPIHPSQTSFTSRSVTTEMVFSALRGSIKSVVKLVIRELPDPNSLFFKPGTSELMMRTHADPPHPSRLMCQRASLSGNVLAWLYSSWKSSRDNDDRLGGKDVENRTGWERY